MSVPFGWSLNTGPGRILATVGLLAAQRVAVRNAAEELRTEWIRTLSQPGRGQRYGDVTFITKGGRVIPIRGGGGAAHTASAPGDPPAPDTGISRNSIQVGEGQDGPGKLRVGTNERSLLALEFGVNTAGTKVGPHPGGIVIAPRPHARPARVAAQGSMSILMETTLRAGGKSPLGNKRPR